VKALSLIIVGLFVAGGLFAASSGVIATCGKEQATIQVPKQSDWTGQGIAIGPGPSGSWDARLHWMISPSSVVKKDGMYFLYYIGADGDRRPPHTDAGPRHRALGVATSHDGITFTKYSKNPILMFLPNNNDEEGIFSAAATLDQNGNVVLYYGAMDAGSGSSTDVDSDIRLAISENGLDFTDVRDVVCQSDSSVWGHGDELFPLGTFRADEKWYVYYIAKGYVSFWNLGIAWGLDPKKLPYTKAVLTSGAHIIGGGDPVWLGPDKIGNFILRDFDKRIVEVRTAASNSPDKLSDPVDTYNLITSSI